MTVKGLAFMAVWTRNHLHIQESDDNLGMNGLEAYGWHHGPLCFAEYITKMEVDAMQYLEKYLEKLASLAEILTAVVASLAYAGYRIDQFRKMKKLEDYLRKEKAENSAKSTHTTLHLMAILGLTEDEILRASFRSKHIRRVQRVSKETGLTSEILFAFQA